MRRFVNSFTVSRIDIIIVPLLQRISWRARCPRSKNLSRSVALAFRASNWLGYSVCITIYYSFVQSFWRTCRTTSVANPQIKNWKHEREGDRKRAPQPHDRASEFLPIWHETLGYNSMTWLCIALPIFGPPSALTDDSLSYLPSEGLVLGGTTNTQLPLLSTRRALATIAKDTRLSIRYGEGVSVVWLCEWERTGERSPRSSRDRYGLLPSHNSAPADIRIQGRPMERNCARQQARSTSTMFSAVRNVSPAVTRQLQNNFVS